MNIFETLINVIISSVHNFLKDISKLERSHDFQSWLVDIIIAIQILNCFEILNNDTFSSEIAIETRFVLQNKAWIFAQTFVKNLIFNVVSRKVKKFIQQKTISYLMIIELKNKFTRKDDSRVIEIHVAIWVIIFETYFNIHDFAIKLRTLNDDFRAIHDEYVFSIWEMNFHFVNNFIDVYDSFITNLLIANDDFIKIKKKMNWQTFVNRIVEVEIKIKIKKLVSSHTKFSCSFAINHVANQRSISHQNFIFISIFSFMSLSQTSTLTITTFFKKSKKHSKKSKLQSIAIVAKCMSITIKIVESKKMF